MTLSRNIDYSEFLCFFERIIIIYLLDTSEYVKKKKSENDRVAVNCLFKAN